MEDTSRRDVGQGAFLGALSAAKNKKVTVVIGGILMAIGFAGMALMEPAITNAAMAGYNDGANGFWYQMKDYAWMFILIAGLFLVIYSFVSVQRESAKKRGMATGSTEAA